jgi:hypothetical protein
MSFIIEGMDGTGKSYLSAQLSRMFTFRDGVGYSHSGRKFGFYEEIKMVKSGSDNMIYDRLSHLSEQVYGPILRGFTEKWLRHRAFDRACLSKRGVVILCDPGIEAARKSWEANREYEVIKDLAEWTTGYYAYQKLITHLPVVYYDWTRDSTVELFSQLEYCSPSEDLGPGSGHFQQGNVLIVADRCNLIEQCEIPFAAKNGSSIWLSGLMDEANIPEDKLYWANSFTHDGNKIDPCYMDLLEPSKIFALGREAEKYLKGVGVVPDEIFPHPQFWKRFNYNSSYSFVSALKGATDAIT